MWEDGGGGWNLIVLDPFQKRRGKGRGEVATLGHFPRVKGLYHMIKLFNQGDKNMNGPICPT